MKVVLTEGSVYQRIRRKLIGSGKSLRIAREAQRDQLGKCFFVQGAKVTPKVDPRCLASLEPGDTLLVAKLDRLARSTRDLLNTANAALSVLMPDCFSANTWVAPAALRASCCASSVCPSVETRAYPLIIASTLSRRLGRASDR